MVLPEPPTGGFLGWALAPPGLVADPDGDPGRPVDQDDLPSALRYVPQTYAGRHVPEANLAHQMQANMFQEADLAHPVQVNMIRAGPPLGRGVLFLPSFLPVAGSGKEEGPPKGRRKGAFSDPPGRARNFPDSGG